MVCWSGGVSRDIYIAIYSARPLLRATTLAEAEEKFAECSVYTHDIDKLYAIKDHTLIGVEATGRVLRWLPKARVWATTWLEDMQIYSPEWLENVLEEDSLHSSVG